MILDEIGRERECNPCFQQVRLKGQKGGQKLVTFLETSENVLVRVGAVLTINGRVCLNYFHTVWGCLLSLYTGTQTEY